MTTPVSIVNALQAGRDIVYFLLFCTKNRDENSFVEWVLSFDELIAALSGNDGDTMPWARYMAALLYLDGEGVITIDWTCRSVRTNIAELRRKGQACTLGAPLTAEGLDNPVQSGSNLAEPYTSIKCE